MHPTTRIVRATDQRKTAWCRTIVIYTRSPMPEPLGRFSEFWVGIYKDFFLKLRPGKLGHDKLRGEYNSIFAINCILPFFTPKPLKWGTLAQDPDTHFLLSRSSPPGQATPDINGFIATLATLHLKSQFQSSTFGFSVTTYIGSFPQMNRRTATWEEYFSTNMRHFLDLEKDTQGPYTPEMNTLSNTLLSKVIPRLLRPLETYPNALKPTLLHGNLKPTNVATSAFFRAPIVYDPCSFYGHNEYDLRAFVGGKRGVEALEMYHRLVPISEPIEDFGDRMRLYHLRNLLHESCERPGERRWRERLVEEMRVLVGRYPGGWQDWVDGMYVSGVGCWVGY